MKVTRLSVLTAVAICACAAPESDPSVAYSFEPVAWTQPLFVRGG